MFSIAALNDTDSKGQREPLAPTKEAQEFHITQSYHEGLLKLHNKDYESARELLELVLKDPLISSAQVDGSASDGHLLQLRFLALKNLATVFLQQGSIHYESALHCYLQAVEIDAKDSVIWNQLGTLSCSMGLLSISRWAFEQGLVCSPNNWNCMEKLLEVLIAIGDEIACLSVTELILRHWPSHSRALHVKRAIKESVPIPFAPRGIDKLEPEHARLKFLGKRKVASENTNEGVVPKRLNENMKLHLAEVSWGALADALLEILLPLSGCSSDLSSEGQYRSGDIRLFICLPPRSGNIIGSTEKEGPSISQDGDNLTLGDRNSELEIIPKEKEAIIFEEHPQERRSSRLERLRNRKPGKEEVDSKELAKVVIECLQPFIVGGPGTKDSDDHSCSGQCHNVLINRSDIGSVDVVKFISNTSKNYGAYHLGYLLLEEIAAKSPLHQDSFVKLLELEKLTRQSGQVRTPECCLFLAELYYDFGFYSSDVPIVPNFISDASYQLCKIIEFVALDYPFDLSGKSVNGSLTADAPGTAQTVTGKSCCRETLFENPFFTEKPAFWARFFWLSGRISFLDGNPQKAHEEFCLSLLLLAKKNDTDDSLPLGPVRRPYCKVIRELTTDRVLHDINLLEVDFLLKGTVEQMMEKDMYLECINLLAPLLFSVQVVHTDLLPAIGEKGDKTSIELSALDIIIKACEKAKPMNSEVYINCHWRRLQLLFIAAGMDDCLAFHKPSCKVLGLKTLLTSDAESKGSHGRHWNHLVAEEVQAISECASLMKEYSGSISDFNVCGFPIRRIGEIQSLLMAVMYNIASTFLCKKSSALAIVDQTEQKCFANAAIAFCKLQHLNTTISLKSQVEFIVAMHELLAAYGLCCVGVDGEGEEGTFLKLAIKHLLALDMKLKSNFPSSIRGFLTAESEEQLSDCNNPKPIPSELKKNEHNMGLGPNEVCGANAVKDFTLEGTYLKRIVSNECKEKRLSAAECGKQGGDEPDGKYIGEKASNEFIECSNELTEDEKEELELAIDNALDQCFFCLYGLNLRSDSSYEDDLAVHKNTSRGDYHTKEQCADVFQYILPNAKASSRTGLIKLRRVLRAIRKHFPQPPDDVLSGNTIERFLDDPDLCEDKVTEAVGSDGFLDYMMKMILPNAGSDRQHSPSLVESSKPYFEVYCNLYYLLAQSEEMSATDKWPGFVLTKEGEEFVEQNANLFKFDLLYNPLRFESWQGLANIYDEEVDLLLNDGSKHINVVGWRKNATLMQRVETSRRRSRRCLLMSLALAKTQEQQSEIHELLALVYYDSLQCVVPFYDQRSVLPSKDAAWKMFCRNSMKHFKEAFSRKQDWSHAFYLGKLSEKLGCSHDLSFSYYDKAIVLNPSAVDSLYRMHASRLKLLYTHGTDYIDALKVITTHSYSHSTKETVMNILEEVGRSTQQPQDDTIGRTTPYHDKQKSMESHWLVEAYQLLYGDCLSALQACVEGDLKHFHKARYMLAKGLYRRGERGDLERAKEELSFCFKSSRSSFTINMWEIDGMVKKGRRKSQGLSGSKRALEVNLPESSRKFITCIRKYILFYLKLLEETEDICTLDRAYTSLRADKRFSLCLEDLVPVALGRYMKAVISLAHQAETSGSAAAGSPLEHLQEKMFTLFMEQGNLLPDICNLPEIKGTELSESSLLGYLYQYIQSLEENLRLETLEGITEKMRKRFKNPKLSNSNCAKVCKHATIVWCRAILISLALITPSLQNLSNEGQLYNSAEADLEKNQLLCVDLKTSELWNASDDSSHLKYLESKWGPVLSKFKHVIVTKVWPENMETANNLLKCCYNFYRESSSMLLSFGVNVYIVPTRLAKGTQFDLGMNGVEHLDISVPRKLLLWAYALLHGRYTNISAVIKHCEENAKSKMKKGSATPPAPSNTAIPAVDYANTGGRKDGVAHGGGGEAGGAPLPSPTSIALPQGDTVDTPDAVPSSSETQKRSLTAPKLQHCNNAAAERNRVTPTKEAGDVEKG